MNEEKQVWRRGGTVQPGGGVSGRQPNFLQKLYDFLALDPHPCPEVMYWASDSRQLVIAQPDRLVKEVLPKLFKHDKMSSFGRQLNIYGFSRLFPGRQFKDSSGRISDASVWAHPSLHRLSIPQDLTQIKRRAAPKLFRTRRLPTGELIRSRAGPAVEAKFRQVRGEIADARRLRRSVDVGPDSRDLADITEGLEVDPTRSFFGHHRESGSIMDDGYGRRDSYLSMSTSASMMTASSLPVDQMRSTYRPLPPPPPTSMVGPDLRQRPSIPPLDMRLYQSCPASFHTSPILQHAVPGPSTSYHPHPHLHSHPKPEPIPKIASPAAVNPFQPYPPYPDPELNCNWPRDSGAGGLNHSWEDGPTPHTIDPRWISPFSSLWTTPAVTPRAQSPIHFQLPQSLPAGIGQMDVLVPGETAYANQSYPPRLVDRRGVALDPPGLGYVGVVGLGEGGGGIGRWRP